VFVDTLIKGGHVIDTSSGFDNEMDVAILDGKIVDISAEKLPEPKYVIDAKGCFVFPGLIDFHAHIFRSGSDFSVPIDVVSFPSGVTTICDGGSAGVSNYPAFRTYISTQETRVKSLLNVCHAGLSTLNYHENVDPACWNERKIIEIYERYREELLGLKVRQTKNIVGDLYLSPLKETLKLAKKIGCRTVVHVTDPAAPMSEIVELLGPDDIFCHVYQGAGMTILDKESVHYSIIEARKRGVIFDAANGMHNFNFEVAERAIAEGFLPDIIASDLSLTSLYKTRVFGLPYTMSKYMAIGMKLGDVVKTVTSNPAALMKMDGIIGTLMPGAFADVSIFKIKDVRVTYEDAQGNIRYGDQMLVPQMTLRNGAIYFRQYDFYPGE
jgi:predicted amidohydrolase